MAGRHAAQRWVSIAASVVVALTAVATGPALAAGQSQASTSSSSGLDVSYPQCGTTLPSSTGFAIVGVNGGRAGTLNTCFGPGTSYPSYTQTQLYWAVSATTGPAGHARAALYVNTGDPTNVYNQTVIGDWPQSGSTPYGQCTTTTVTIGGATYTVGQNSNACAWQYGYNKAVQDVQWLSNAANAIDGQTPPLTVSGSAAAYPWWLDVETANTWQTSTSGLAMNVADLQGMITSLEDAGAITVGVYSTSYQWGLITGGSSAGSLQGVPDWIPGASSSSQAQSNCSLASFTSGSVDMTQWTSTLDNDLACQAVTVSPATQGQLTGSWQPGNVTQPSSSAQTVTLTTSSGGGHFSTSASQSGTCTGPASLNITVPSGTAGIAYSYCDAAAGTATVTASATGLADGTQTVTVTQPLPTQRVWGQDAIGTALAVSAASWQAGSAKAVVLARSDFFSDALAGGPLAAQVGGPLLITPGAPQSSSLDSRVQGEIQRILPAGGTVYMLGGPLALSSNIDSQLEGLGYKVVRVAGNTEFDTAVAIADQLGDPSTVFEATGTDFPDALSAVPAAIHLHGAILLTDANQQAAATATYLQTHSVTTRYAIGGPQEAAGADHTATAVWGQTLYDTSAAVAEKFFPAATTFGAATGAGFPDALSGGVFMGLPAHLGPVLLVQLHAPLPSSIAGYIANNPDLNNGYIFGGTLVVADDTASAL